MAVTLERTGSWTRPAVAAYGVGTTIAGRYRVERHIADGGMGSVYEATDLVLGERVALKTLRPHLAGREPSQRRFRRELSLARKVTHDNVCRVFEVVFEHTARGSVPFLAMEFLDGETLADRIQREGRLGLRTVLAIASQVGAALDCAHRAGIIHRDFKSRNIILVASSAGLERAVVCDFGVATANPSSVGDASIGSGVGESIIGSPPYMAPEQLAGSLVTARADIWGFGVLLYEMITGRLPFDGPTTAAIAMQQRRPPPRPTSVVPGLDRRWDRVIAGCLALEPTRRFPSAAVALAVLDEQPRLHRAPAVVVTFVAFAAMVAIGASAAGGAENRSRPSASTRTPPAPTAVTPAPIAVTPAPTAVTPAPIEAMPAPSLPPVIEPRRPAPVETGLRARVVRRDRRAKRAERPRPEAPADVAARPRLGDGFYRPRRANGGDGS